MGFIENDKALCMLSVLTNTHMLLAACDRGVERFFYSFSACVCNGVRQKDVAVVPLKEEDVYPALPEDGYGWERLFSERRCRHFEEDFGLQRRVARFHNVYGPLREMGRRKKKGSRSNLSQGARWPSTREIARSKSGAMVSRHAASCTSMTAPMARRPFPKVISANQSTWVAVNLSPSTSWSILWKGLRYPSRTEIQAQCSARRQWKKQRQYVDQNVSWLGTLDPPSGRFGEDLRMD